jgi:hypothetical protein
MRSARMIKHIRFASLLIAGVSSTSFTPSLDAHEDNVMLYPATMCRLRGDNLRDGLSAVLSVSQFGWIGNRSNDLSLERPRVDLYMLCPIPRFARSSGDGVEAIVRFRDPVLDGAQNNNGRTRFCCWLHNARPNTIDLGADFTDAALPRDCENLNSAFFGDAQLELTSSNRKEGPNLGSDEAGSYGLICRVPPGAMMIDYTVHERH